MSLPSPIKEKIFNAIIISDFTQIIEQSINTPSQITKKPIDDVGSARTSWRSHDTTQITKQRPINDKTLEDMPLLIKRLIINSHYSFPSNYPLDIASTSNVEIDFEGIYTKELPLDMEDDLNRPD
jgi:hypothetical protein